MPFNLINKNFKISELKNNQINLINVDFKFSHPFKKISKISKQYNEKSFLLALGLMKRKIFSGMINGPITKFIPTISSSIQEFRKLINPIRKIIETNGYISGKDPGIEDYIFLVILNGFILAVHAICWIVKIQFINGIKIF